MKSDIVFGYDILTYNGEMPNCLDPKFLPSIYQGSDFDYSNSLEFIKKRWNVEWALYNSSYYDIWVEKKSIFHIKNDRKNGKNYRWFYPIEPFGNLEQFFGVNSDFKFALDLISKAALKEIVEGNGNLLINYLIDGGTAFETVNFEKFIKFTRENNIPDEKVYFVFSDFKLKENLEKLNTKYKVLDFSFNMIAKAQEFYNTFRDPNYKYWGEDAYEPQFGKPISKPSTAVTKEEFLESIGKDKKDFLLLNRHFKLHRLLLLSQLYKMGLEKNLVSWDKNFYFQVNENQFLMYDNNPDFLELIKNTSSILDVVDITRIAGFGYENKEIYLNSYVNIVTESVYFQQDENFPSGYLSEKIWKPIGHCQPFILAGPSKSLKYIKERFGYKTFHPYIDETYDLEENDFKRLELIQKEIEKFASKTKEEKDEFLNNVKDICIFNQNLFLNYGVNSWKPGLENTEIMRVINFLMDYRKKII